MSNKVKEKEEIKEEVEEIEDESTNNEENSECNIDNEKDKGSDDLDKECKPAATASFSLGTVARASFVIGIKANIMPAPRIILGNAK